LEIKPLLTLEAKLHLLWFHTSDNRRRSGGILLCRLILLLLLIFWEIVTVLYLLIQAQSGKISISAGHEKFRYDRRIRGALLLGILMVWTISGTLTISEISLNKMTPSSGLELQLFYYSLQQP